MKSKVHVVKERKREMGVGDTLVMFCGARTEQNPELTYVEYPLGAKRVDGLCEECGKRIKATLAETPSNTNRKVRKMGRPMSAKKYHAGEYDGYDKKR